MQLKTERLTIRRVIEEDWKGLQRIWKDFSTSEYAQYDIPHVTADEDVRARVRRWAKFNKSIEHMFFAICIDNTIIGYVAFNRREDSHEIGYCFLSDYHGMGYAKESHIALFDYLRTLGITRFTAGTALRKILCKKKSNQTLPVKRADREILLLIALFPEWERGMRASA